MNNQMIKANCFALGLLFGAFINYFPAVEAFSATYSAFAETIENLSLELPKPLQTMHRSCYSLNYDGRLKNASWVYERLTKNSLEGAANRSKCQFVEDQQIPKLFRTTLQDYRGTGYDRGHLAPAANHKASFNDLEDTFILSNTSPQHPEFNRGYWAKFEKHIRDLTCTTEVVHVFTGPLFLPQINEEGTRWVKYQVIGKNDVAVPTHFYKILCLEGSQGEIEIEAYILPNESIDPHEPFDNYKTTVQKIEKTSGIIFSHLAAKKT